MLMKRTPTQTVTWMSQERKRRGPQVDLASDGLPLPIGPLSPDQAAVRHICATIFGGNIQELADALVISRSGARYYIIGNRQPGYEQLENLAKHLSTTVEAIRAPSWAAIWAAGAWLSPGDPAYDQARRNLIAADPDLEKLFEDMDRLDTAAEE